MKQKKILAAVTKQIASAVTATYQLDLAFHGSQRHLHLVKFGTPT